MVTRAALVLASCLIAACDGSEVDGPPPHEDVTPVGIAIPLAPRSVAHVDMLARAGSEVVAIVEVESGMLAVIENGALALEALRGARGTLHATASLADARCVEVTVELDTRAWAYAEGTPYVVEVLDGLDDATASTAWARVDGVVYGTAHSGGVARVFRHVAGEQPEIVALPDGASEMVLRHAHGGALAGAVRRDGQLVPATLVVGGETTLEPQAVDAEYFVARDDARFGTWVIDGAPHAMHCSAGACATLEPPTATSSSGRDIADDGTLYGCAEVDGKQRAFRRQPGGDPELLEVPARGCISDVTPDGRGVGVSERNDDEVTGVVVRNAAVSVVRADRAWQTILNAADGVGLMGAIADETGRLRAAVLAPLATAAGVTYTPAAEPEDPHLAHACGHSTGGPFETVTANVDATLADAIVRTHTNHAVTLTDRTQTQRLRLENPRAGRVTLHLSNLVGVTLRNPAGAVVPTSFADTTDRCELLRGFVQYALDDVGTYVIELAPTAAPDLHIVYERTWPIER